MEQAANNCENLNVSFFIAEKEVKSDFPASFRKPV